MLRTALFLNLVILVLLVRALSTCGAGGDAFGPDTVARRNLTRLCPKVVLISAVWIALHFTGHAWALPMAMALLAVLWSRRRHSVSMCGARA